MDNLTKMASEIQSKFPDGVKKNITKLKNSSPQDTEQILFIAPSNTSGLKQQNINTPDQINFEGEDTTNTLNINTIAKTNFIPDVYTIFGYSLPKNTLYLILILIVVGIIIWYVTSNKKKKKEKSNENVDEKDNK